MPSHNESLPDKLKEISEKLFDLKDLMHSQACYVRAMDKELVALLRGIRNTLEHAPWERKT